MEAASIYIMQQLKKIQNLNEEEGKKSGITGIMSNSLIFNNDGLNLSVLLEADPLKMQEVARKEALKKKEAVRLEAGILAKEDAELKSALEMADEIAAKKAEKLPVSIT